MYAVQRTYRVEQQVCDVRGGGVGEREVLGGGL